MRVRVICGLACALAAGALASPAGARVSAHGALVHPFAANQSNNWYGYNQGTLEKGGTLFHQISGDWTVPTASQHTRGQDEFSSTWIGIGGGCIDAGCLLTDATLIQTGTEQDVDSSGHPSYSAWWEIIPLPGITIPGMTVSPGNHMHADIREVVPYSNVWRITLKNVTTGKTFMTTIPYTSTHLTAEWIQETPLIIGTGGTGLAALPNLSTNSFFTARTNGLNAGLKPSEEMQLVDENGKVIALPSAPNATRDGFNLCSWATSCPAP